LQRNVITTRLLALACLHVTLSVSKFAVLIINNWHARPTFHWC